MFRYTSDGSLTNIYRRVHAGTTLALTEATLFDGDRWIENSAVVLDNGRIAQLGTIRDVSIASDVERISLDGQFLLPGLIDCWITLTGQRPQASEDYFARRGPVRLYRILADAHQLLAGGVTTVVHAGGCPTEYIVGLQEAIAGEDIVGPTIVSAGRAITASEEGGNPEWFCEMVHGTRHSRTGIRDSTGVLLKCVRTNFAAGANLISVVLRSDESSLSYAELSAIVEEGHRVGALVLCLATSSETSVMAVDAGVDLLLHGPPAPDNEFVGVLLAGTTAWAPALYYRRRQGVLSPAARKAVADAHADGVTIVVGTGQQDGSHSDVGAEVVALHDAGLPLDAALAAGTTVPTALLAGDEPRLAEGQHASFIVLDTDPRHALSQLGTPDIVSLILHAVSGNAAEWQQLLMRS